MSSANRRNSFGVNFTFTAMRLPIVLVSLMLCVSCSGRPQINGRTDSCANDVIMFCTGEDIDDMSGCNADFGGVGTILQDLQTYANAHLAQSMEYLLMSAHFGTFEKSREGFEKLFMRLSDVAWKDSLDLIVYITKRGGKMDFTARRESEDQIRFVDHHELGSLARALDNQKALAEEAHRIHKQASSQSHHDPEVKSFLEERFIGRQAGTVYQLSSYVNDLKHLLMDGQQTALSLFVFDEHLKNM